MVTHCLEALQQVPGVHADLIDLRWLDRASLDWDTIEASVRKTNRVLIVEQGAIGTSYGGWLSDEIQRRLFDWLDAPIESGTGAEASPPISKVLERAAGAKRRRGPPQHQNGAGASRRREDRRGRRQAPRDRRRMTARPVTPTDRK